MKAGQLLDIVFIGRISCGCIRAWYSDFASDRAATGAFVSQMITSGYIVDRIELREGGALPSFYCASHDKTGGQAALTAHTNAEPTNGPMGLAALMDAARAVLSTELGELASTGSDAPAEHALGLLRDALDRGDRS